MNNKGGGSAELPPFFGPGTDRAVRSASGGRRTEPESVSISISPPEDLHREVGPGSPRRCHDPSKKRIARMKTSCVRYSADCSSTIRTQRPKIRPTWSRYSRSNPAWSPATAR